MKKVKYDIIGYWSEIKLEVVREYASAYSRIMNNQSLIRRHIYIDAFAGAGQHISKRTGEFVAGSPLNALLIEPPFSEFHLIDLDGTRAAELRRLIDSRKDALVHEGDANDILLKEVLPRCRYEDFHRGLCLLDPYALNLIGRSLRRRVRCVRLRSSTTS